MHLENKRDLFDGEKFSNKYIGSLLNSVALTLHMFTLYITTLCIASKLQVWNFYRYSVILILNFIFNQFWFQLFVLSDINLIYSFQEDIPVLRRYIYIHNWRHNVIFKLHYFFLTFKFIVLFSRTEYSFWTEMSSCSARNVFWYKVCHEFYSRDS